MLETSRKNKNKIVASDLKKNLHVFKWRRKYIESALLSGEATKNLVDERLPGETLEQVVCL